MSFSPSDRDKNLASTIVDAFGHIEKYLINLKRDSFLNDQKTQDAVAMRLQQILECASKISEGAKSQLSIDWPSLVAMRHKVSHHYVDVDPNIVWEVIKELDEFNKLINWAKVQV